MKLVRQNGLYGGYYDGVNTNPFLPDPISSTYLGGRRYRRKKRRPRRKKRRSRRKKRKRHRHTKKCRHKKRKRRKTRKTRKRQHGGGFTNFFK